MTVPRRSAIAAILFDLDGVLIDSYEAWFNLFNRALEHFGYDRITEPVFRKHWGQSTAQDVAIFMPRQTVPQVRSFFFEHYGEYLNFVHINKHAHTILARLQNMQFRLGCVTNSHRQIVESILHKKELSPYFEVVLTADDVLNPKPAPDLLLRACETLKLQPQDTIFIGDTRTDIQAGTSAGCIVVSYRLPSTYMINELTELKDMVNSIQKKVYNSA